MLKGIMIMDLVFVDQVYPSSIYQEIQKYVEFVHEPMDAKTAQKNISDLKDVEVIFSGWGGLTLSESVLKKIPNLKAVFYGAGSIKKLVTQSFWDKDILITSANQANAIPVAEYTLAAIIMGLKQSLPMHHSIMKTKTYPDPGKREIVGGFKPTIGLVSLGAIARHLIKLLEMFDYEVIAYDPFVDAGVDGIELVDLETLFKRSDVVSLHTPLLPETKGMIDKKYFEMMKENAVFINTARGAIVNESEMIEVLKKRKDITAYLDVVYPEPPAKDSLLYELENVFLTPHIAGSEGNEVARMGQFMLDELKRFVKNEPLKYEITKSMYERMA